MKAAVFSSIKPRAPFLEIDNVPAPEVSTGAVVVRVLASRVLPYAWEIFAGIRKFPTLLPIIPGAGAVGIIKSVGPDIVFLKPGQLVLCDITLRAREDPRNQPFILQGLLASPGEGQQLQSVWRNGAWAEEILVPAENVYRIPSSIQMEPSALSILTTLSVPFGALFEDGICAGSTVVVTGATGHFGTAAVAIAVALGARRVIPTGRSSKDLDKFVKALGSRVKPVVLSGNEAEDTAAIVEAAGKEFTVDVHFDMLSPEAPFTYARAAMRAVRRGGRIILMGGVGGNIEVPYLELVFKNVTVKGVFMFPRHIFPHLMGLVDAGLLDLKLWETKTFPLEAINDALLFAKDCRGVFENTVVVV